VADYVLMGYGTGAIMAVPAHDTRDFEFAKTFDLPMVAVVRPDDDWFHDLLLRGGLDREYCAKHGKSSLVEGIMDSAVATAGLQAGVIFKDAQAILDGDPGWIEQVLIPAYTEDPGILSESFIGESLAINSSQFDGLSTPEFIKEIDTWLTEQGTGREAVNYKLRDWIFSRQKYWGEPFPIVHGDDGQSMAMAEGDLPLTLPELEDYAPTPCDPNDDVLPEPPLGRATEWLNVKVDGRSYRRDTNTMPQWAGSCWYFLRFCDPLNDSVGWSESAEKYWMPVDVYMGGAEHAVLHLLYARFWHKVLCDLGHVSTIEPFARLINQGMIQAFAYKDARGATVAADKAVEAEDGKFTHVDTGAPLEQVIAKISKSLKNVVRPDEVIAEFGTDAFRMYEMYMGPIEASKPWNTRDVPGLFRLLNRVWRLVVDEATGGLSPSLTDGAPSEDLQRALHKTIKKVGEDVEAFKFNTAIGQMFDFVNFVTPLKERPRSVIETFVLLVSPFAPHLGEELWHRLGHTESLAYEPWPAFDPGSAVDKEIEVPVQINGKVRARVTVPADADDAAMESAARAEEKVAAALEGKTVRKVIVVKGRLVNIVCG
jgi:leucyl-tRNA synthetase